MDADYRISYSLFISRLFNVFLRTPNGRPKERARVKILTLAVHNGDLHWRSNDHPDLSVARKRPLLHLSPGHAGDLSTFNCNRYFLLPGGHFELSGTLRHDETRGHGEL